MVVKLHHCNETLVVINSRRSPTALLNGNACSLIQHILKKRKIKSTCEYQKEIPK